MPKRIHTAIVDASSHSTGYFAASSKKKLREEVRAYLDDVARYTWSATVAYYWGHDCRVVDEVTGAVIGTDGHPDETRVVTL